MLAGVVGVVQSTVGTVAHQATVPVLGAALPVGLVLAIAMVVSFAVALRLMFDSRIPGFAFAAGVILVLAVFGTVGPGGSVLIPSGALGMTWTVAPGLAAVVAALWPAVPAQAARVDSSRQRQGEDVTP